MIREGTLPFLFACANIALIQLGPDLAAQAVRLMGRAYQPSVYSICMIAGSYVLIRMIRRDFLSSDLICLIAAGSLAAVTIQMTVCVNEFFHMLQYGILGYLLGTMSSLGSIQALFVGAAFGVADELIQAALPGRFFELRDILMNLIASAGGVIAAMTYQRSRLKDGA